jgi:hypothetical protein
VSRRLAGAAFLVLLLASAPAARAAVALGL